jgi:hypothetical protein
MFLHPGLSGSSSRELGADYRIDQRWAEHKSPCVPENQCNVQSVAFYSYGLPEKKEILGWELDQYFIKADVC